MLFKLLGLPISAPVGGFKFIMRTLADLAERELYDEGRIREEYLLLQLRLDEGEITEEQFVAEEKEIMARLRAARARREQASRSSNRP